MSEQCEHLKQMRKVTPSADGCEDCLKTGDSLRVTENLVRTGQQSHARFEYGRFIRETLPGEDIGYFAVWPMYRF